MKCDTFQKGNFPTFPQEIPLTVYRMHSEIVTASKKTPIDVYNELHSIVTANNHKLKRDRYIKKACKLNIQNSNVER